jgi:hypothetical protein
MTESLCMAERTWGKEGTPWERPIAAAWRRLISEVGEPAQWNDSGPHSTLHPTFTSSLFNFILIIKSRLVLNGADHPE